MHRSSAYGARGVLDPSMPDSDLDGIMDGLEDPDDDGLNRYWFGKEVLPRLTMIPQTLSVTLILIHQTASDSMTTLRITQTSKNSRTAPIQSQMIQMVTTGMMVLKFTTKTMMKMGWPQVGNSTSSSIHLTVETVWSIKMAMVT